MTEAQTWYRNIYMLRKSFAIFSRVSWSSTIMKRKHKSHQVEGDIEIDAEREIMNIGFRNKRTQFGNCGGPRLRYINVRRLCWKSNESIGTCNSDVITIFHTCVSVDFIPFRRIFVIQVLFLSFVDSHRPKGSCGLTKCRGLTVYFQYMYLTSRSMKLKHDRRITKQIEEKPCMEKQNISRNTWWPHTGQTRYMRPLTPHIGCLVLKVWSHYLPSVCVLLLVYCYCWSLLLLSTLARARALAIYSGMFSEWIYINK